MTKKTDLRCNHELAMTAFCPHCGVDLGSTPIDGLRRHLVHWLADQTTRLAILKKKATQGTPAHEIYFGARVKKGEASIQKWGMWLRSLDALIQIGKQWEQEHIHETDT